MNKPIHLVAMLKRGVGLMVVGLLIADVGLFSTGSYLLPLGLIVANMGAGAVVYADRRIKRIFREGPPME